VDDEPARTEDLDRRRPSDLEEADYESVDWEQDYPDGNHVTCVQSFI